MTQSDVSTSRFDFDFAKLTGHCPIRWQKRLFRKWFLRGRIPSACDIPTGLGKTSVMAIWYLAFKAGAEVPRRLVYVVDRRVVVDQATAEANRIKHVANDSELSVSTLRGQHIDNREWLANPAAPAIIVGTVDMIGSRLLFSGYGVSRKMRPYHAGLLGADALIVLDEAHLVPPFQELLKTITNGTGAFGPRTQLDRKLVPPFRLLSLSATGRTDGGKRENVVYLESEDWKDDLVMARLNAPKRLVVCVLDDASRLVEKLAGRAWMLGSERRPARVLVYCDRREDAEKVKAKIDKKCRQDQRCSELLVGGRRVYERQKLSDWLMKNGFLGDSKDVATHPTFLIATSAGEVGVDLNADHMVCDLVEWERMVQRMGRVNRYGKGDARIEVIAAPRDKKPVKNDKAKEWEKHWKDRWARLWKPLDALRPASVDNVELSDQSRLLFAEPDVSGWNPKGKKLQTSDYEGPRDASPGAILDLRERATQNQELQKAIEAATTPAPLRPSLTRALVDAWSLTSLDQHTGRPDDIQPWLRGWEENPQPQTTVIWRKHMPVRTDATNKEISAFFEAAPPHVSEKLETETHRVFTWLTKRAEKVVNGALDEGVNEDTLTGDDVVGYVLSHAREWRHTVHGHDVGRDKEGKDELKKILVGNTLVVDMRFGGLSDGMLNQTQGVPRTIDGGKDWLFDGNGRPVIRFRVRPVTKDDNAEPNPDWRERLRFDLERTEEGEAGKWLLVEKWRHDSETEDDRSVGRLQELSEHHAWTEASARNLANALNLSGPYTETLIVAARLHDEGKRHRLWQLAAKAPRDGKFYAKTDRRMNVHQLDGYRHEFGSLPYAERDDKFKALPSHLQELALHLVAAHHGWARPVISTRGCDNPPSVLEERARDVVLRFARLQKRWGPWGLAWWESLLRAADQQASRKNDERGKRPNRDAGEGA